MCWNTFPFFRGWKRTHMLPDSSHLEGEPMRGRAMGRPDATAEDPSCPWCFHRPGPLQPCSHIKPSVFAGPGPRGAAAGLREPWCGIRAAVSHLDHLAALGLGVEMQSRRQLGFLIPFLWNVFFFLIFLFIYDSHRERERERGRDTGRGRSRLHAPGARCGTRSRVSRIAPWAKGRPQTAAPPRDPHVFFCLAYFS